MTAGLWVGRDGRGSGTATRAGIKRVGWGYGQTALVTAIRHEKDHLGIAQQFFMPSGPLAILPLKGGHHSSIVWSETDDTAAAIRALPDAEYLEALRPRFGDFPGEISLAGDRFTYPLSLSLAERFIAPRVALVGDAAHGVHPIAGQGLNLGLRDVAALAEVLIPARRRGEEPGSPAALEEYQRWRRFDSTLLALGMDTVNRLFASDNPVLRLGRDLGMGVVNAIPGLRRGFIRQAAGLTGELPEASRGAGIDGRFVDDVVTPRLGGGVARRRRSRTRSRRLAGLAPVQEVEQERVRQDRDHRPRRPGRARLFRHDLQRDAHADEDERKFPICARLAAMVSALSWPCPKALTM